MVKVRAEQPLHFDGSIDLELWLSQLNERCPDINLARIREVCDLSQQAEERAFATNGAWIDGVSSFKVGLDIADILTELYMDEDGLVAGLIYRAVRENQITLNHVKKTFGDNVAGLVEGILRMAAISDIELGSDQQILGERSDQLEQARRMLVALVDDVRVVLIKLAERTCAIRNIAHSSADNRTKLAREVFDIYAPLAHRLGIGHLKWELEDIAFRYLETNAYKRIARLLDEKRSDRQEYIARIVSILEEKLGLFNIVGEIGGRAKHIYSIWRKMRRKGIQFSEVYDVRAVRILVPEVNDCYRVLGIVHNLWRNVPYEFDDYIATPKENGYRSLHTAVIGPEGKALEIQIRTHEMHKEAELGVCSHWQYKSDEGETEATDYQGRVSWLRQILDWQDDSINTAHLTQDILREVALDRIYVFTPDGHVVDLTPGATPIDFAYRVHTEVGHKCRGAKINGRVVPLNHKLRSGDQVKIITGDDIEPQREWLYEHLGYISTGRARAKIRSWLGNRNKQKNITEGEKLLSAELFHLGIDSLEDEKILALVGYNKMSDLYSAIGSGELNSLDVIGAASELFSIQVNEQQLGFQFSNVSKKEIPSSLRGVGDFEHIMASCCVPDSGDLIVGLIDDKNIVHVHKQDCLLALRPESYNKLMQLEWQTQIKQTFPVNLEINAFDRSGLLHDITGVFLASRTNVIAMQSVSDKLKNSVLVNMTMEVISLNELLQTLEKIEQVPNVISARRKVTN
ncbi:MAG: GTP pyrophosphokinase [Candidatus Azotimanducaceae bacterium]|jgi:GTP pyrophosphokinase